MPTAMGVFNASSRIFDPGSPPAQPPNDEQRHHKQKHQAQDQSEGQHAGAQHCPYTAGLFRFGHVPDAVKGTLQFREHGCRADDQQDHAVGARNQTLARLVGVLDHARHRQRALSPDQALHLRDDLALHSVAPKTAPAMAMTITSKGARENTV